MAQLINQSKNVLLSSDLQKAFSLMARTKGLLGRESMEHHSALWIKPCSSIHTYFMKFAIDVVFVDKNLKVTSVRQNVSPWKLLFSTLRSDSVFEFASGVITTDKVQVGDQLYVDC